MSARRAPDQRRADDSSPSGSSRWSARPPTPRPRSPSGRDAAALTRFANSFIHQNVAEELTTSPCGSRWTAASRRRPLDGPPDDEALGRLVDGALEAARVSPPDPDWPGLAPPAAAPDVDHWDDATAEADAGRPGRARRGFVAAAGGLETAGACATDAVHVAFANSAGQAPDRPRDDGAGSTGSPGRRPRTGAPSRPRVAHRRARRRARRASGPRRKARDASRPHGPRAGSLRGDPRAACVADLARVPRDLRVQRPGRRGGPLVRPRRRAAVRPVDHAERRRHRARDDRAGVRHRGHAEAPRRARPGGGDDVPRSTPAARRRRPAPVRRARVTRSRAPEPGAPSGPTSAWSAGDRSPDDLIGGVERGLLVTYLCVHPDPRPADAWS